MEPVLQLEDGSFAGAVPSASDNILLVFDTTGNIKWTLPGYYPVMATAGGGLVASGGESSYAFDEDGNATGQVVMTPFQSWVGNTYQHGSVVRTATLPVIPSGRSFWAQRGGNPSGTGAKVFTSLQLAAFSALSFIWPYTWDTDHERGGLICRSGPNRYYWTGPVTQFDQGEINVSAFPDAACFVDSTRVGNFHSHGPTGQPYPSGALYTRG